MLRSTEAWNLTFVQLNSIRVRTYVLQPAGRLGNGARCAQAPKINHPAPRNGYSMRWQIASAISWVPTADGSSRLGFKS
jgi:hypothetical protein